MARYELPADGCPVSLHDCVITGVNVDGNMLELRFDGGINLIPESELNPGTLVISTGPAVLRIRSVAPGEDHVILQRDLRLFGRTVLSLWKELTVAQMTQYIRRHPLEVITRLQDGAGMLLDGWAKTGRGSFGLYDSRFLWRIFALEAVFCFDEIHT